MHSPGAALALAWLIAWLSACGDGDPLPGESPGGQADAGEDAGMAGDDSLRGSRDAGADGVVGRPDGGGVAPVDAGALPGTDGDAAAGPESLEPEPPRVVVDSGVADGDLRGPDLRPRADTILLRGPNATTPLTVAHVEVRSTLTPERFRCRFDGELLPCGNVIELEGLSLGRHTLSVAAIDHYWRADRYPVWIEWTVVEGAVTTDAVAVGHDHACLIDGSGALYCWGNNAAGQLGQGNTEHRERPRRVGWEQDWELVDAGRLHSCGLRAGELHCWGSNTLGQLGLDGPSEMLSPERVAVEGVRFVALDLGEWHGCAISDGGELYCWGYNLFGRVGDGEGLGTASSPEGVVATPTRVDGSHRYLDVAAGAGTTCGVRLDGTLHCWGLDDHGQLGGRAAASTCWQSSASAPCSLVPLQVGSEDRWIEVDAGTRHLCARDDQDRVVCWGDNRRGQVPGAALSPRVEPRALPGTYQQVAAGGAHTCAVDLEGEQLCWGDGTGDQLGGEPDEAGAAHVRSGWTWAGTAAGDLATCGVVSDGMPFCWGTGRVADGPAPGYPFIENMQY